MSFRMLVLGAALCGLVSCITTHPIGGKEDCPPLSEVQAGMSPHAVLEKLGSPTQRASGWWSSSFEFDMDFKVWYYKNKGRVIFSIDGVVYASEADAHEDGRPGD